MNPHKYRTFFENVANLKILNYLEMCNRMDTTPYYSEFSLIKKLDRESFSGETYQLSNEQFQEVVKNFQYRLDEGVKRDGKLRIQQLAMNVLSIHTTTFRPMHGIAVWHCCWHLRWLMLYGTRAAGFRTVPIRWLFGVCLPRCSLCFRMQADSPPLHPCIQMES